MKPARNSDFSSTSFMRYQCGFTLVEVTISAVLLAVGLLGMGALQTTAMRYTYNADLRAKAVLLAYDMGDRMRSNMDIAASQFNDSYNGVSTDNLSDGDYSNQNCSVDSGTPTVNGCTKEQMVIHDAYWWTTYVSTMLPNGFGEVVENASLGGDSFYSIKVRWADNSTDSGTAEFNLYVKP